VRVALALILAAWGLCGAGVAAADSPHARPGSSSYSAVSALLNPDGTGRLFADSSSAGWSWQACTVSAPVECTQFGSGNPIDVGDPPAGTYFVGSSPDGGAVISPVWDGTLQATRPPTSVPPAAFGFAIRANGVVSAIPALWAGGWAGDADLTQLAACANPDGADCTSLTDPEYVLPPSCAYAERETVIDPVFTGWYLRVADTLYGPDPAFAWVGRSSPYGAPVWPAGPLTAVAVVGQIAPATGPRTDLCGPPPLPPGADPHDPSWCLPGQQPLCSTATISAQGGVEVWCMASRCRVSIIATRRRATVRYRTSVAGFVQLTLRHRLIARLGHGRALLEVEINGRRQEQRYIRI
jgi:hypothetical protein